MDELFELLQISIDALERLGDFETADYLQEQIDGYKTIEEYHNMRVVI